MGISSKQIPITFCGSAKTKSTERPNSGDFSQQGTNNPAMLMQKLALLIETIFLLTL
jgi:hypothetical protein